MPANMASTTAPTQTTPTVTLGLTSSAAGSSAAAAATSSNGTAAAAGSSGNPSATPVPHIRIVPHLDAPRSLHFDVFDKDVPEGVVLKIGRFTDKQSLPNRITFRSKVVSRGHAEIFTDMGKFYIRDTKSSSGTFLNHARLSPPGCESKPTLLKDGDVVQLGVDYQGGTQEIYRCVKMRLEINRGWQQQANPFRQNTLKAIKSLTTQNAATATDCCICLFRIASFQSLFVAPCSHIFHYKCIRPMLVNNHPGFLCPLCRTFADLEDSVEIDDPTEEEQAVENAIEASKGDSQSNEAADEAVQPPVQDEGAVAAASPSSEPAQPQNGSINDQQRQQQEESSDQGSSSATSAPVPVNSVRSGNIPSAGSLAPPSSLPPMSPGLNDISAPTPPSDLAHTFLPLQRPLTLDVAATNSNANNLDTGNNNGSIERLHDADARQQRSRDATMSPTQMNGHQNVNSGALSSPLAAMPIPFATTSPARPISTSSNSSSGSGRQQTTQQQQRTRSPSTSSPSHHHHTSSSASSPSSNFLSNFMRSMTMPRSRSRTNSANHTHAHAQPPASIQSQQGQSAPASSSSGSNVNGATANGSATNGGGDFHHDVYGKTLVMTPPSMLAGPLRVQPLGAAAAAAATTTGPTSSTGAPSLLGTSLGPVTEMDAESLQVEDRVLQDMREEDEQASEDDGGAPSSLDDGLDVSSGDNSSSDGDVLMFNAEAQSEGHYQQRQINAASTGGCEVAVGGGAGIVGASGADDLQRAQETMTA